MFSRNFYYKINYQIKRKANFNVFFNYILDRLKHPFVQVNKKKYRKLHQAYLQNKRTSTDYFSINAYYWNSIIKKNFSECWLHKFTLLSGSPDPSICPMSEGAK